MSLEYQLLFNTIRMTAPSLTNRMVHEEASGMGLDESFFSTSGIDPNAEFEPSHSRHCAWRLAFGDGVCECGLDSVSRS